MSKLEDFLGLSDVSEIKQAVKVTVNGKELELVIRPITQTEHSSWQSRSNNISKNKVIFDSGKYADLILSNCIVEPDFRDAEFLAKAKCTTCEEFLHKKFPAGVLMDISSKIQELSGFNSIDVEIENAKN